MLSILPLGFLLLLSHALVSVSARNLLHFPLRRPHLGHPPHHDRAVAPPNETEPSPLYVPMKYVPGPLNNLTELEIFLLIEPVILEYNPQYRALLLENARAAASQHHYNSVNTSHNTNDTGIHPRFFLHAWDKTIEQCCQDQGPLWNMSWIVRFGRMFSIIPSECDWSCDQDGHAATDAWITRPRKRSTEPTSSAAALALPPPKSRPTSVEEQTTSTERSQWFTKPAVLPGSSAAKPKHTVPAVANVYPAEALEFVAFVPTLTTHTGFITARRHGPYIAEPASSQPTWSSAGHIRFQDVEEIVKAGANVGAIGAEAVAAPYRKDFASYRHKWFHSYPTTTRDRRED